LSICDNKEPTSSAKIWELRDALNCDFFFGRQWVMEHIVWLNGWTTDYRKSVSQQLVKSQNSLMEKLQEVTLEIRCVSLKCIGSRLLF
jgi:hypothetical protein